MSLPAIYKRMDAALERARWRGLTLRGIYLDPGDYAAFARTETSRWRNRTGSTAKVWPLSYGNVLIIGGAALPVKEATKSAVYADSGEAIYIAKRLSHRVKRRRP